MNPISRLLNELNDPQTMPKRRAEIGMALAVLGDDRSGSGLREDGLPDIAWCFVAGKNITLVASDDQPLGDFQVRPFYIAKYPITYLQFKAFVDATDNDTTDQWWA